MTAREPVLLTPETTYTLADRVVARRRRYIPVDVRLPADCIDPRDRLHRPAVYASIRTAAGGIGLFGAAAIVRNAFGARPAATAYTVLARAEAGESPIPALPTMHTNHCLRVAYEVAVLELMHHPTDDMLAGYQRLVPYYADLLETTEYELLRSFGRVADGAARQAHAIVIRGVPSQEELIARVRQLHPEDDVVAHMSGTNRATAHLTIHEPAYTFDASATPSDEQLYVDTVGAAADLAANGWGLDDERRLVAAAAVISGSLATRAALDSLQYEKTGSPLVHYEAMGTGHGLDVVRFAPAA